MDYKNYRQVISSCWNETLTALNVAIKAGTSLMGKVTIRNSADDADIDPLAESTFTGRIGEVQASPTANTILDRLKALLTGIVLAAGTNNIGKVGHDISGIADNRKVVTTAGTRVALAASTTAKYVIITAETDNTGVIVVGGATVVATLATRRGTPLNPGETCGLPCDNLADVYIDATVSGDGVTFTYLT